MQYSSSWLRVFIFYWHRLIPRDNSRLFLVCAEGSCSGRQASSQQAYHPLQRTCMCLVRTWLSSVCLLERQFVLKATCNRVKNLHQTETQITVQQKLKEKPCKLEEPPKSVGERAGYRKPGTQRLLTSDPLPVTWLGKKEKEKETLSFPHTSDLVNSLKTARLGNPNRSDHPRWGSFLPGRKGRNLRQCRAPGEDPKVCAQCCKSPDTPLKPPCLLPAPGQPSSLAGGKSYWTQGNNPSTLPRVTVHKAQSILASKIIWRRQILKIRKQSHPGKAACQRSHGSQTTKLVIKVGFPGENRRICHAENFQIIYGSAVATRRPKRTARRFSVACPWGLPGQEGGNGTAGKGNSEETWMWRNLAPRGSRDSRSQCQQFGKEKKITRCRAMLICLFISLDMIRMECFLGGFPPQ